MTGTIVLSDVELHLQIPEAPKLIIGHACSPYSPKSQGSPAAPSKLHEEPRPHLLNMIIEKLLLFHTVNFFCFSELFLLKSSVYEKLRKEHSF